MIVYWIFGHLCFVTYCLLIICVAAGLSGAAVEDGKQQIVM